MRVLVLTTLYPPHAYGGYEALCRDVVEDWMRRGHEVMVLTSDERVAGAPEGEKPGGPPVARALRLYWREHRVVSPGAIERLSIELHNQRALRRALESHRPRVVSAWAMGGLSLGLLTRLRELGLPTVFVVGDEWPIYAPAADAWTRSFSRRSSRVLALGRMAHRLGGPPVGLPPLDALGPACFISKWLQRKVVGESRFGLHGSRVVYPGIDLEHFGALSTDGPSSDEARAWGWRLLCVGRLDARKGYATAIEALSHLPEEASLTIDGRGDDAHRMELLSAAEQAGVGPRVRFMQSSREDLPRVYGEADALVFPSEWEEPFGLVPLEAMSCGTPVVASASGGASEYLSDRENCLLVPPRDALALASALELLASDAELRARIVAGGSSTARRFGLEQFSERLIEVHEGALA